MSHIGLGGGESQEHPSTFVSLSSLNRVWPARPPRSC